MGRLPRGRFTSLPVPDAIAPFYTAGRGGLGSCLMNTYNLPVRPLYNIPALTLHECAPGHSFQAALALEAPERPDFRGETYFSGYRSEEHTSELQSLMRTSYAVSCLKKKHVTTINQKSKNNHVQRPNARHKIQTTTISDKQA